VNGPEVINNFLPQEDFNKLSSHINSRPRETSIASDGEGSLTSNAEVNKHIITIENSFRQVKQDLDDYELKDVLFRYENKTGFLHHDLNRRGKRKYSLILYTQESREGGEIVFPFYDSSLNKTTNAVTETCSRLHKEKKYVSTDENLNKFIIENKNKLYSLKPKRNLGVIIDNDNNNLWHFVTPTSQERSCAVLFWERK